MVVTARDGMGCHPTSCQWLSVSSQEVLDERQEVPEKEEEEEEEQR